MGYLGTLHCLCNFLLTLNRFQNKKLTQKAQGTAISLPTSTFHLYPRFAPALLPRAAVWRFSVCLHNPACPWLCWCEFPRLYMCVGGVSVCYAAVFTVHMCLHPFLRAGLVCAHGWAWHVCGGVSGAVWSAVCWGCEPGLARVCT